MKICYDQIGLYLSLCDILERQNHILFHWSNMISVLEMLMLVFRSFTVNLTMILPYILKLKDSTQIIWMLQGNKISKSIYNMHNKSNICFQKGIQCFSIYFHFQCLMYWFMKYGYLLPKNVITCNIYTGTRQWFRCSIFG